MRVFSFFFNESNVLNFILKSYYLCNLTVQVVSIPCFWMTEVLLLQFLE